MKSQIIGRQEEIRLLKEYLNTKKSEFIAVYGRRRVGKTFLVRQVIGEQACFSLTGMENSDLADQLAVRRFFDEECRSCSPEVVA